MIQKQTLVKRGKVLVRHFSDKNVYIKKVGTNEIYISAIDVYGNKYEYEETDILIPVKEEKNSEETIK